MAFGTSTAVYNLPPHLYPEPFPLLQQEALYPAIYSSFYSNNFSLPVHTTANAFVSLDFTRVVSCFVSGLCH